MAYLFRVLFGIGLLLIFYACAQNQDMLNLNDQYISLNKRISTLEQSQGNMEAKLGSDLEARLKAIYSTQAELRLEMDRLRGEFNKLTGRVEDNDNLIKRTFEKDLTGQDNMKAEVADLHTRVKELDKAIKHLEENLRAGLEAAGKTQPTPLVPTSQPASSAATPAASAPVAAVAGSENLSDKDLYNNTLNLFKEGKTDEAFKGFKSFLEKFPKSELAGNAQFWIGECHMSNKQYNLAILAYQAVIEKYPTNNKVPNAMLRQGVAFELYGDKKSARALYKRLIEKFPTTSEAKTAKERLAKLD
jgi:tol-pal system protein YbgF